MADPSVTQFSRWDDFMLVRAFGFALHKYQEMHGHPVDPPSGHAYPASFTQEDTSVVPSLDHLQGNALQPDAAAKVEEVFAGDESDDIDDAQLEDLIQAAHALQVDAQGETQAEGDRAVEEVGNAGNQGEPPVEEHTDGSAEGPGEKEGHVEEYTDAQYYEWLYWQATQQGAAAAVDHSSPLQTVVHHHHHHYYYSPPGAVSSALLPECNQEQSGNLKAASGPTASEEVPAQMPSSTDTPHEPSALQRIHPPSTISVSPVHPQVSSSLSPYVQAMGASSHSKVSRKPPYQPTPVAELGHIVSISAMEAHSNTSVEELRFEDYPVGTHSVRFCSHPVQDDPFAGANSSHSLTAMPPFSRKSLEELRWDDYSVGKQAEVAAKGKEPPAEGGQDGRGEVASRGRIISDGKKRTSGEHEVVANIHPWWDKEALVPQVQASTSTSPQLIRAADKSQGAQGGQSIEEPPAAASGPFPQPLPSTAPQGSASLPEIDPALQDLLSAYYWMGYQTARYLQSRGNSSS